MFSRKYKSVREWTHEKRNRFTELACKDPMFPTPGPGKRMDADGIPEVNYAVIGAGITGCSVAHTMLRHEFFQNDTIMVLEASDRTGGAAGISHAQVAPATAIDWGELVRRVGVRSANQAVVFSHRNLARLGELCAGLSAEDRKKVQFRRVKMVTNFANREPRNLYRRWDAAFRRMFTHLGNRFAEKDAGAAGTEYRFRIKSTSGAVEGPGATLNVGEFVNALFNEMLREHDGRISVRTNTAVRKIKYMSDNPGFPWLLHTSCGLVWASSVIYCCNGRVAHLNHRLLGKLFPVNYPMSVEGLTPCPPDDSGTYSWRLIQRPTVDYRTGTFKPGQYSVVQDGHSLTYQVSGGPQTVASLFPMSGEDALQLSKNDHRERLHRLFRQPVERLEDWLDLGSSSADEPCDGTYRLSTLGLSSRCVGYTADALPLVGVIPVLNNHTRQNRQWVAAGCNGQGLDKCWLMGEYLVAMIAGEFVDNRLPDCYQITHARLSAMRPQDCLNRLLQVDTYEDRTPINTYLVPN